MNLCQKKCAHHTVLIKPLSNMRNHLMPLYLHAWDRNANSEAYNNVYFRLLELYEDDSGLCGLSWSRFFLQEIFVLLSVERQSEECQKFLDWCKKGGLELPLMDETFPQFKPPVRAEDGEMGRDFMSIIFGSEFLEEEDETTLKENELIENWQNMEEESFCYTCRREVRAEKEGLKGGEDTLVIVENGAECERKEQRAEEEVKVEEGEEASKVEKEGKVKEAGENLLKEDLEEGEIAETVCYGAIEGGMECLKLQGGAEASDEEEGGRCVSLDYDNVMDQSSDIKRFVKAAYWFVPTTLSQLWARDAIMELLKTPLQLGSLVYLVRMISDLLEMAQLREAVIVRARLAGPTTPLEDQAYMLGITTKEVFAPDILATNRNCCQRNRAPLMRPRNAQEYYMYKSFWNAVDMEFSFKTIWQDDRLYLVGYEGWNYDSYDCGCHQVGYRITQGLMLVETKAE